MGVSLLVVFGLLLTSSPAIALDSDLDGVDDLVDNCPSVPNPRTVPPLPGQTTVGGQPDDDADGTGNACDCDFTGDGFCNVEDFNAFLPEFIVGVPEPGSGTDMTGDGFVNIDDFLAFFPGFHLGAPGANCGPACGALQLGCSGPACPPGPNAVCAAAADALCVDRDLLAADDLLDACLAGLNVDDPGMPPAGSGLTFGAATLFRGFTRSLRPFLEQADDGDPSRVDTIREVLDALGFSELGRNPFMWFASRDEAKESCFVDGPLDVSAFQAAIETELLPALDQALAELAALEALQPVWDGSCDMPAALGPPMSVELDETDALALRAGLHFLRGILIWLMSYDAQVDLQDICESIRLGPLGGVEQILADHPNLLEFEDGQAMAVAAVDEFLWTTALAKAAVDSALAEPDDPSDDLLSLVFETPADEQALRMRLQRLEDSLLGPTRFPKLLVCGEPFLDAGAFFEVSPRSLLPPFTGNQADYDLIPDTTFGGTLTPFSFEDLACVFETDPPEIIVSIEPESFDFSDVEIRLRDEGSGVDPGSVRVMFRGGSGFTINGLPAPPPSPPPFPEFPPPIFLFSAEPASNGYYEGVDVTHLFDLTIESNGDVVLEGRIACDAPWFCPFSIHASGEDRNRNPAFGEEFARVVNAGLLLTFTPPSGTISVPTPIEFVLTSQDDTETDPDERSISMSSFRCEEVSFGGVPIDAEARQLDVSAFFDEDGDDSDLVRTMTAQLDVVPGLVGFCNLSFCIDLLGPDDRNFVTCQSYGVFE